MAADLLPEDVVENILIGLDVEDLILCKGVCKSWRSLITSSRFIKRHLNLSYNKDRCNTKLGDRRIILSYEIPCRYQLVGSSNGLVCIIYHGYGRVSGSKVLVGNPLTREVRQLEFPSLDGGFIQWGFGYDSFVDDYKVVAGVSKGGNQTCFQVLSLRSNVWKDMGEVKYRFIDQVGVLCNGALHWFVRDENYKKSIISYDLCKEEFKEISQPDDSRYVFTPDRCLGVIRESICIFQQSRYFNHDVWLMKNYNVKESWELLLDQIINGGSTIHELSSFNYTSLLDDVSSWFLNTSECYGFISKWDHINEPIFVKSLVSPHVINGDPGPN